MPVADPRESHDLIERRDVTEYDPGAFDDLRGTEAFESGWVTTATVVDSDGRLLLVQNPEGEWYTPGGTRKPGETLPECLVREVREEAGVGVVPERPHVATESIHRCGEATLSFTVVTYSARPETTRLPPDDQLGLADEQIVTADWFATLPDEIRWGNRLHDVLERLDRW